MKASLNLIKLRDGSLLRTYLSTPIVVALCVDAERMNPAAVSRKYAGLGISENTVRNILDAVQASGGVYLYEIDVEAMTSARHNPYHGALTSVKAVTLYVAGGMSAREVAERLRVPTTTVDYWLRAAGVFRPMSQAQAAVIRRRAA